MAVDLNFGLLTDASRNFGNSLVQAAGQVRQHRETAQNEQLLGNYLANPNDASAFNSIAKRNPQLAYQIQDHHLEAARNLRADHAQQLDMIGQILTDPHGNPITADQYPQALALARQAGIDVTGHETFDPAFVNATVQLHQRLHPVAPVSVAEGGRLVNPQTGAEVAAGNPRPPRYYPVQPGGTLVRDPGYQDPSGEQPAPPAPTAGDVIAINPTTGQRVRLNPQTNQWEPVQGGPTHASGNFPG